VPFWQQACQQNARNACSNLAVILDTYCADGSGWACNEVGMLRWHQRVSGGIERVDADFERGCGAGFARSCQNRLGLQLEAPPLQAPPQLRDYPVILREGKGALPDRTPEQVLTRACTEGWMIGCEDLGGLYLRGDAMTAKDPPRAAAAFERACDGKVAMSCSNAGYMYYNGDGIPADKEKGLQFLKRSCDLGYQKACQWMKEYQ
jgi:TPR repeat protein